MCLKELLMSAYIDLIDCSVDATIYMEMDVCRSLEARLKMETWIHTGM